MLPLEPELLVATATVLASWEYLRNEQDVEHDRASADAKRREASLQFIHFAGFWSHYDRESRLFLVAAQALDRHNGARRLR